MSTKIPFFVITFYACPEDETYNVGFDYDGSVLRPLDSELASDCFAASIKSLAIIDDLFADPMDLLDRVQDTSDNFNFVDGKGH